MKYLFQLTFTPTDGSSESPVQVHPLHSDDLAISIDRKDGEWYYTRKLSGTLTFVRDDYNYIMSRSFDGTFAFDLLQSTDGVNYYPYFAATFSRASLEIDEDNHTAKLDSLSEGIDDLLSNGKDEEFDLKKIIPDDELREVQGQIPPALALVDECSEDGVTSSDLFCGTPLVSGGYRDGINMNWSEDHNMEDANGRQKLIGIWVEIKKRDSIGWVWSGMLRYQTISAHVEQGSGLEYDVYKTAPCGNHLRRTGDPGDYNGTRLQLKIRDHYYLEPFDYVLTDYNDNVLTGIPLPTPYRENTYYSPIYYSNNDYTFHFHYIYASYLLNTTPRRGIIMWPTILDVPKYYNTQRVIPDDTEPNVQYSLRTVEESNGHRIVPGTNEPGQILQYFAPPDDSGNWIPINEEGWNFASLWYTIAPATEALLTTPSLFSHYSYPKSWTIGTCIRYLLNRISSGKIVFAETPAYSQFLYSDPNPLQGHEQFQYLITQKSNVMRPNTAQAARCIVRLQWFLELLQNAFNCYYWLEKRNDGKYDFRIEHVEYFRNGGSYTDSLASQFDLTTLKPHRNFFRNNQPVKRYADQTNKYSFDLNNMAEKYTFSWQGDGGSDDFKGNPMCFRAGWIDKGKSESHEVDNIFADLGWLMLNAGTDTASSKNYEGVFLFAGYRPALSTIWNENARPSSQTLTLASGIDMHLNIDIWCTIPAGETASLLLDSTPMHTYTGTGEPQQIHVEYNGNSSTHTVALDFGANFYNCIIHRFHAAEGNIFYVPNVENLLRPGNNLQNGPLAWPWLQNEFLHYDIPANKWSFDSDDPATATYLATGTIKLVKKQTVGIAPFPTADPKTNQGIKTGLGIGLIDSAKVNLGSRNVELTLLYDINPNL